METSVVVSTPAGVRAKAEDPLGAILAGQPSAHTRRAYRHDLGHLLAFLSARGGSALAWRGLTLAQEHALIERACAAST